jgi:hypothetical protein
VEYLSGKEIAADQVLVYDEASSDKKALLPDVSRP